MAVPLPFRLILASASIGRRELLKRYGYEFDICPSQIDEPSEARLGDCRHYVGELAWLKAAAVAKRLTGGEGEKGVVIIAADTVGWLNGQVIGKPVDRADAKRILGSLAGTVHELWTGVCLWRQPGDWQLTWQERSLVRMKALTIHEIEAYLETRQWEGCSGAYAIQMPADPYLQVIEGSVSNVIGLPMESLERALRWLSLLADD